MATDEFHWRIAETDVDAKALAPLILIDMYREVGRSPLDPNKAFTAIYSCMKDGGAAMIFKGEKLIGSIGLVETNFWYSNQPELVEQWSYIVPQFRGAGALRCLFEAARHIAREKDFDSAVMIVFNEQRARARSQIAHIGEQFEFRPAGEVIRVEAAE